MTGAGRGAVVALLLLVSCGYRGGDEVREIAPDDLFGLDQTTTSTTSTTTSTTSTTTTVPTSEESALPSTTTAQPTTTAVVTEPVELYYLDGERMSPIQQNLSSPTSLSRVLDALEAGPPRGGAGLGLRSALPRGVINTPSIAGGVATVDLVPEAYERIESDEELPAIAQIVLTLTRRPGLGQVRFTLDGEPLPVRLGSNLVTEPGEPVARDDYLSLLEDVDEPAPVESEPSTVTTSAPTTSDGQ